MFIKIRHFWTIMVLYYVQSNIIFIQMPLFPDVGTSSSTKLGKRGDLVIPARAAQAAAAASPSALLESQKFLALVLRQGDVTGCDGVANNRGRYRAERTLSGARAAPFTCVRIRTFFPRWKPDQALTSGRSQISIKMISDWTFCYNMMDQNGLIFIGINQ